MTYEFLQMTVFNWMQLQLLVPDKLEAHGDRQKSMVNYTNAVFENWPRSVFGHYKRHDNSVSNSSKLTQ